METIHDSTKRKKRRTRKCLDELRKRSRKNTSGNSFVKSECAKVCNVECKSTNNCLLTSDRLTLQAMFPKAIRSETITRPILAEIKQKQGIHVEFVRDQVPNWVPPVNRDDVYSTDPNINKTVCSHDLKKRPQYKGNNSHNQDIKLSHSITIFSPNTSLINKPLGVSQTPTDDESLAFTITTPLQTSHDGRNFLYQEFMDEFSLHFKEMTSSIIKEDVIKNTYNNLKNMYIESCEKEYEDNILKCINDRLMPSHKLYSENEPIVENPLDYIRLQHAHHQKTLSIHQQRPILSESSSSSSAQSPVTPLCPTPCTSSTRKIDVVLYDTPEYNYYPHRLN